MTKNKEITQVFVAAMFESNNPYIIANFLNFDALIFNYHKECMQIVELRTFTISAVHMNYFCML